MINKRLQINLGNVVIGSSLEALLYAYYNKYKVIFTKRQVPDQFDEYVDFGLGPTADSVWNKYMFLLTLAGYVPFSDTVKHIQYVDLNTLKIVTHEESVVYIKYDNLYVFDDKQFLDLPVSLKTTSDRVRIVDWFRVETGAIHEHNFVQNKTNFMNQVIFFRNKINKSLKRKDVCVVSYCKKDKIEEYPEHLVKIKTEQLMCDLGIETATKHKVSISIDHRIREIKEFGKNVYEDFDNVKFIYDDARFIYQTNQRRRKIDYMKYVSMKLGI